MSTTQNAPALTIAQRRVLAALGATPRDAYQVRDALGAPRTTSAFDNVTTVLNGLAAAGVIHRRPGQAFGGRDLYQAAA